VESSDNARAQDLAARALAHRDLSVSALRKRLEAGGVGRGEADRVVGGLVRSGLVDDVRLAQRLASSLADRGFGDGAILARLEAEGIDADKRTFVLSTLEAEERRAVALAKQESARGLRRLSALLARRGFGDDAVETALESLDGRYPGEGTMNGVTNQ
jgi:SOS response regulatory protein OraA/RecX